MALLLTEGCDSGLDRWTVNNSVTILSNQSQFGTGYDCFRFANNAGSMFNHIRKDLIVDDYRLNTVNLERPDYRVSFWMKLDTNSIVANTIFLRLSNRSANADWELAKDGRLQTWQLRTNYTSGALAANAALAMPSLADGNWHFIEIYDRRFSTASGNGQINLWVDRTSYISTSSTGGFRTGSVFWNAPTYIQIGNVTGANLLIDDVTVWNDYDGSYVGNTRSNTRIYTLRPIGDDNLSNTSISDNGDILKYKMINEANANTQSFINIGNADRFNMSDINVSSNIFGGIIITKLAPANAGYQTTIRIDAATSKNSKTNYSNTYFGTNTELLTTLDLETLGNTSSLMNSLKIEIKKSNTVSFVPALYAALPVSSNVILNLDASNFFSYPGTGTTWYDTSGYNHNATLYNGVTYTNTNSGEFLFNRNSAHYASITSTTTLRPTSMSIFTWVYPYSIGQEEIIAQSSWRLESRLYVENQRWGFIPSSTEYPGSVPMYNYNWYCLCITYTTSALNLYKNGLLEASFSTPASLTHSLTAITLAQGVGIVNRYFYGKIAMYVMYNKALTASEVLQNYNASKGRFFSN